MKQGLSLRVSQHLALTPQLQQSIRLLQLSTLELGQEVEQMLDENPFLEKAEDGALREEFGLAQADAPISQDARDFEAGQELAPSLPERTASASEPAESSDGPSPEPDAQPALEESWEGDGSVETAPDDSEWGSDAPARKNNNADDDEADAIDLARDHETLQQHLHRQALSLRLSDEDRAALHFLIESLNDDGYLDGTLQELAAALAGDDLEELEELEQRFAVALGLLHHMEPAGVGARDLAECLSLQLLEERNSEETRAAIAICKQPMELLAKRDVKRLMSATGFEEVTIKAAIG
ncbi:MAG: RNA polymerase factor sigma-54, partial [Betaproteobacteria bacterium]